MSRRTRTSPTAVSLVVVFGSVAMLALPLGAVALGFDPVAAGAWSGASIHEVGQVVVAGGLVGGAALQVAVAVKLGRVLMLAPVLAVISLRSRRTATVRPPLVPGFVLAFVACAAIRTFLPMPAAVLVARRVGAGRRPGDGDVRTRVRARRRRAAPYRRSGARPRRRRHRAGRAARPPGSLRRRLDGLGVANPRDSPYVLGVSRGFPGRPGKPAAGYAGGVSSRRTVSAPSARKSVGSRGPRSAPTSRL